MLEQSETHDMINAAQGELTTEAMANVRGSSYSASQAFEIKDFSFGVENPTTIGSATGGAGGRK